MKALRNIHIKEYSRADITFKYVDLSQEKTINSNSIPIPDFIYEIIERNMDGDGLVFALPENGSANRISQWIAGPGYLGLRRKTIWRTMVKNKLNEEEVQLHEKISSHFGRYTYTRILDETTLVGRDIQENLGHKRFTTIEGCLKSDDFRRFVQTFKVVAK